MPPAPTNLLNRAALLRRIAIIDERLRHLEADMIECGWQSNAYIAPVALIRKFVTMLTLDLAGHMPAHDMSAKKAIDPGPASRALTLQQRADLAQVGKDGVHRVGPERPLAAQDTARPTAERVVGGSS